MMKNLDTKITNLKKQQILFEKELKYRNEKYKEWEILMSKGLVKESIELLNELKQSDEKMLSFF